MHIVEQYIQKVYSTITMTGSPFWLTSLKLNFCEWLDITIKDNKL